MNYFIDQLDGWFSRPRHRTATNISNVRNSAISSGSGNPVNYNNDGSNYCPADFGLEQEEALLIIEKMDEKTLEAKFEAMLNEMNLSEEKKEPLRQQPFTNKKKMVINHYKGMMMIQESKSKFDKPGDYIAYLQESDLSSNKLFNCVESLRIALTNNPLSWLEEFGTPGLKQILNVLSECNKRGDQPHIRYECLRCLRAIMNNTIGLRNMLAMKDSFCIVARSLDPRHPTVMCEAVKVLAALCLVPNGHEKVLEAITLAADMRSDKMKRERFGPVIEGLASEKHELKVACFQLINAIIAEAEDLDFRLHLRNEIWRTGLAGIIETLRLDVTSDLKVQVETFDRLREDDFDDFCARFDNVRLEIDDVNDCFELIKTVTLDTPAEPYFLSILQHLLLIRDDNIIRPAYFKLIEECVTQIVLHKNGLDPDFTKRFEIDVQPLIETLADKEKIQAEENKKIDEINAKLENEIILRQETEAKLALAENKLKELGADMTTSQTNNVANIAKNINIPPPPPIPGGPGIPPPPPPPPGVPPPPPMPGSGGPPPPPPPPMPGAKGFPPPPPPMMGMNGGPPPPPFPGMGPPPPPPPVDVLPYGLKPKKKWDVSGPLKRANWKTILPQKMSEKAFWVKCQEDKLASPDILNGLVERFSSKPVLKRNEDVVDKIGTLKKVKDLKVLDGKAAQNISILIGGSLKHLSYEDVKKCILRCDDSILGDNVLQQLIQYLPPPDQLKKLQEYKNSYEELTEAEQFCVTLSEIKRLLPRLKSLSFRLRQSEMVKELKPDIVAGTAACEEVKSSKKFAKILELVLLLGNFMNSGSKNGQAFGFEMSFLTKLTGTKDVENKQTLLHYLVETVESKFPECLNFADELSHVDRASRVSFENIQKTLKQMDTSIKNLETDLVNSKIPQSDDDKFAEVMGAFAKEARQEYDLLQNMFKQMDALYTDLSEYYAFDKQKYVLEEFFSDIKTFKDSFEQAYKDNIRIREQEEKSRRAKLAREHAEKERSERVKHKKQLIDMNAAQEGVMDSLMEALQTGSAFSREQKRKRGPRVAGAERRAQLNRSRSRTGLVATNALSRELHGIDIPSTKLAKSTNQISSRT